MNTTPHSQERQPDGRTVRDIALHSPALVNEVWCRKILRQVLQSLDTQYANGEPHRLIMPDTIVIRASGDAILLPDPDANADFQTDVAADLRALAAVIHYTITHEMPATAPLAGRGLEGYSDSLLGAVDRCMSPNKTQRPQTVAELRDLLGMVSVGLLKPSAAVPVAPAAPAMPAPAPVAVQPVDLGPPASPRKWLWIALAAVLLGGALYIVRQHGAEELVGAAVRVPAETPPAAPAAAPAPAVAPDASAPAIPAAPDPAAPAAAPDAAATPAADPAIPMATHANSAPAKAPADGAGTASYRLNVKPWGTVYVDGKRRGVSPPLKRLILPPGRHTVMVENPGFADHTVQVNSVRGASGLIAHDFTDAPATAAAPAN